MQFSLPRIPGCFALVLVSLGAAGCSSAAASPTQAAADATAQASTVEGAGASQPHYYALMFGHQSPLNRPAFSHTYSTWVRATRGANGALMVQEQQDISWLPAAYDGRVCILGCRPERGHDFTLAETLAEALSSWRLDVAVWGPYEVSESLYQAALNEYAFQQSGEVAYIADDGAYHDPAFAHEPGGAYNCIHAAASFIPTPWDPQEPYFRRKGLEWGFSASEAAASAIAGNAIPQRGAVVDGQPIFRLSYDDSSALFQAVGVSGKNLQWKTAVPPGFR
jgi:hypothetical protein